MQIWQLVAAVLLTSAASSIWAAKDTGVSPIVPNLSKSLPTVKNKPIALSPNKEKLHQSDHTVIGSRREGSGDLRKQALRNSAEINLSSSGNMSPIELSKSGGLVELPLSDDEKGERQSPSAPGPNKPFNSPQLKRSSSIDNSPRSPGTPSRSPGSPYRSPGSPESNYLYDQSDIGEFSYAKMASEAYQQLRPFFTQLPSQEVADASKFPPGMKKRSKAQAKSRSNPTNSPPRAALGQNIVNADTLKSTKHQLVRLVRRGRDGLVEKVKHASHNGGESLSKASSNKESIDVFQMSSGDIVSGSPIGRSRSTSMPQKISKELKSAASIGPSLGSLAIPQHRDSGVKVTTTTSTKMPPGGLSPQPSLSGGPDKMADNSASGSTITIVESPLSGGSVSSGVSSLTKSPSSGSLSGGGTVVPPLTSPPSGKKAGNRMSDRIQPPVDFKVNQWTIHVAKKLGQGAYGKVFRATAPSTDVNNPTEQQAAAKLLLKSKSSQSSSSNISFGKKAGKLSPEEEEMTREVNVQRQAAIGNPGVVAIIDFHTAHPDYWIIITELAQFGEIEDILNDIVVTDTDEMTANLLHGMIESVFLLHTQAKIVHRDIKPENFLWTPTPTGNPKIFPNPLKHRVMLSDFGFAAVKKDVEWMKKQLATGAYSPPEFFLGTTTTFEQWKQHDIFSLGATLYVLFYEIWPQSNAYYERDFVGPYNDPDAQIRISPQCEEMLKKMMHPDPTLRLKSEMLMQEECMRNMRLLLGRDENYTIPSVVTTTSSSSISSSSVRTAVTSNSLGASLSSSSLASPPKTKKSNSSSGPEKTVTSSST